MHRKEYTMPGLYIHIPFCRQKCLYCDFPSFAGKENLYSDYTQSLIAEIQKKSFLCQNKIIDTIFFGGGTPTVLPTSFLEKMINTIFQYYTVSKTAEITIEANPGTLCKAVLSALHTMGFNRISIGLQSWQDTLLKDIGRIHNRSVFLKNFYSARKAGFANINIDLMFALPNQTFCQWQETLYSIIALQPEHISAYSLIIEEETPFFHLWKQNRLSLPDEALDRAMYHFTKELLEKNHYHQYEISNFSKKGFESRHNQIYWKILPYIGFGLGAHSFWENKRFYNTYQIAKYIQAQGDSSVLIEEIEHLTPTQLQSEFMFMGLRMTEGISSMDFQKRFHIPLACVYQKQLSALIKQNLLQKQNDRYFLTSRGMDLSNTVFCQFL